MYSNEQSMKKTFIYDITKKNIVLQNIGLPIKRVNT